MIGRAPRPLPPPTTTLVVYRGLPGSGKTTHARAWVAASPSTRARVNRDSFREMLHGGFVGVAVERTQVIDARDALIGALLALGVSVACDDTNLPIETVEDLQTVARRNGAAFEVVDLRSVKLSVCIARDYERGHPDFVKGRNGYVGEAVIRDMWERM